MNMINVTTHAQCKRKGTSQLSVHVNQVDTLAP